MTINEFKVLVCDDFITKEIKRLYIINGVCRGI